jgi:hypothetical protein
MNDGRQMVGQMLAFDKVCIYSNTGILLQKLTRSSI